MKTLKTAVTALVGFIVLAHGAAEAQSRRVCELDYRSGRYTEYVCRDDSGNRWKVQCEVWGNEQECRTR